MNTIKFDKKQVQVVAHRGLSGLETENTNAAFVAAGNRSYYGIETDIHRTADGKFVVAHDHDMKRIAGEDITVENVSLSVLQNIILMDKDGTKDRLDLRPGTLANYIAICKKYEKYCVLELKSDFTDAEIAEIITIIKAQDYLDNVTFISFIYENLVKVKAAEPAQSVQYLFQQVTDDIFDKLADAGMGADVYYKALTEEIVAQFHAKNIVVNCWTVDNKEIGEQLAAWGVDYITSNILE